MAWFGNDVGGYTAQRIINGTDKINITPPKRYVYLVYEDIHGFQGAYGNVAKAEQRVREIAFNEYELDPATPLDYDDEECWGWEATAWWNRIEVID
jgi:hypothetical protein